ncbi:MAG: GTP pyrophosphokinase [Candidatus Thorarchaeota archaeon]
MTESRTRKERRDFLTERAIRFFDCYSEELESISQLLKIRLDQLASAYTIENELPHEAVDVQSRVKSLTRFLTKLEKTNWPMFRHPTEVITDLIGARVICWFIDDCYGMLDYIQATTQFRIQPRSLEDYIIDPKRTGYRAIHLLADVSYDRVKTDRKRRTVVEDRMICEIQIRTKLQDAWAEFTHEVHCKIPSEFQADYETTIAEIARRLAAEDRSALAVREILQSQAEKNELEDFRND